MKQDGSKSPEHAKRRYLSNEESRANLDPLVASNDIMKSSGENIKRRFSPTPEERT